MTDTGFLLSIKILPPGKAKLLKPVLKWNNITHLNQIFLLPKKDSSLVKVSKVQGTQGPLLLYLTTDSIKGTGTDVLSVALPNVCI